MHENRLENILIYENTVDYEVYGEQHITFSIKNKDVADSQRHFFEAMWQEKIK